MAASAGTPDQVHDQARRRHGDQQEARPPPHAVPAGRGIRRPAASRPGHGQQHQPGEACCRNPRVGTPPSRMPGSSMPPSCTIDSRKPACSKLICSASRSAPATPATALPACSAALTPASTTTQLRPKRAGAAPVLTGLPPAAAAPSAGHARGPRNVRSCRRCSPPRRARRHPAARPARAPRMMRLHFT